MRLQRTAFGVTFSLVAVATASLLTATVQAAPGVAKRLPVAGSAPATAWPLPADPRGWTEKVAPALQGLTGDVEFIVTFRQPDGVARISATAPGDPEVLRWLDETAQGLAGDYTPLRLHVLRQFSRLPMLQATAPADILPALGGDQRVDSVTPNSRLKALRTQGKAMIHSPVVNALGYTGAGVGIAVLDTGVDYTHPELTPAAVPPARGKVIELYDAIDSGNDPMDQNGHGTSVAGIAAGSLDGVAPASTVVAVRVLDISGAGTFGTVLDGLNAVLTSVTSGNPYNIRVANLSLGGYTPDWPPNPGTCDSAAAPFKAAFDALAAAGVLVVTAAGNGGCSDGVGVPACVSSALAVGAVYDADLGTRVWASLHCVGGDCQDWETGPDVIACYSDSGQKLDVWAPSSNTKTPTLANHALGCWCENGLYDCCFGGTSAAAPYVSGVAALLFQASPGASVAKVRAALTTTGAPILDSRNGLTRGRVDAQQALVSMLPACAAPVPPAGLTAAPALACRNQPFSVGWPAIAGAAAYSIQIATAADFSGAAEQVTTTPGVALAFDRGDAATYFVRARAVAGCGSASAWSPAVAVTYTPDCGDPVYLWRAYLPSASHTVSPVTTSDLMLANTHAGSVAVRITYFGAVTRSVAATVAAQSQASWTDVVATAFKVTGPDSGFLMIEATAGVVASVRANTTVGTGSLTRTYVQTFAATELPDTLGIDHVADLTGLRSDGAYRTDLDLVNVSDTPGDLEVRLFGDDGSPLEDAFSVRVEAKSRKTLTAVVPAGQTAASVALRGMTATTQVVAFATVVDTSTGSPTVVPMSLE